MTDKNFDSGVAAPGRRRTVHDELNLPAEAEGWAKRWWEAEERMVPLVRVRRDGPRHVGLEINLAPTWHELTDAVAEAVMNRLCQAIDIDDKECRRETPLALHAGGSAFWAWRIPRERAGEVLRQVLALINRDGAAVVRDMCKLPLVFIKLWGRWPTWGEVERWRPIDVRAALRGQAPPPAPAITDAEEGDNAG
jgi:hypothetical protein